MAAAAVALATTLIVAAAGIFAPAVDHFRKRVAGTVALMGGVAPLYAIATASDPGDADATTSSPQAGNARASASR